jgi:hypothetical protein
MRSERLAVTALAALAFAAACSEPKSFVVLSLQSSTATPIDNVDQIEVQVSSGSKMRTLYYPADGMSINMTEKKTLSVEFSHGETGTVAFTVDLLNSASCSIAHGTATAAIAKGAVIDTSVTLTATATADCSHSDGGTPDVPPTGSTLPGCDPVSPQSPSADGGAGADGGVQVCTATQTCQVDCTPPNNAAPRNECVTGGTGGPGTTCMSNADCMPGTQCFDYATPTNTACKVKLCLRYCNTNADCAAFGAGGGGPGSFCEGPVMCPTFLTAYHTCTFNCDPRAAAASNRGGCAVGLACVTPGAMDQVDCACPETTRTKTEGEACNTAADCMPGLICNQMSGTKTCRAICRCDASTTGACTAPVNDCPKSGTVCHAVTNDTIYGVCL